MPQRLEEARQNSLNMPRTRALEQRTTPKTRFFFLSSGHEVSVYRAQGLENMGTTDLEGHTAVSDEHWSLEEDGGEESREDRRGS